MLYIAVLTGDNYFLEDLVFAIHGESYLAEQDKTFVLFDDSVSDGDIKQMEYIAPIYGFTLVE